MPSSAKYPILISAPGAGLGHLTRACSLSLYLAELGLRSTVVTDSIYAGGLEALTGCPIDFIPTAHWKRDLPEYVRYWGGSLVVLDTFPFGLKGEWAKGYIPGV